MKKLIFVVFFTITFLAIDSGKETEAACRCVCVDGVKQNLCSSALDIKVPCIGICPINPPSIAPLPSLKLPPLGATSCRQAQVYNSYTGRYEWRRVCK